MSRSRRSRLAVLGAVLCIAFLAPSAALAADEAAKSETWWVAHPGAGVAAAFGIAILGILAVAGIGCALCVLRAVFGSVATAMDRQARASSPAVSCLVGTLVGFAAAAAAAGAGHVGGPLAGVVAILLVVPAALLVVAGAVATVPLLAERILGPKGAEASALKRSVIGALVLGLALLGCSLLKPLGILMAVVTIGWPLGVGIAAVFHALRSRAGGALPASPASAAPLATAPNEPPRA